MQISGGWNHSLISTDAGDVYSFGDSSQGQLGNGKFERVLKKYKALPLHSQSTPPPPSSHSPVQVQDLNVRIVHVSAGSRNSACLDSTGSIYTWGYEGTTSSTSPTSPTSSDMPTHHVSRLGLGPPTPFVAGDIAGLRISEVEWKKRTNSLPRLVSISVDRPAIKTVVCGADHTICVTRDGDSFSWGLGEFGQLGHGTIFNQEYPKMIDDLCGLGVSDVACGAKHSVVVTVTGRAYSFGFGGNGRLGNGWLQGTLSPSLVRTNEWS